MSKIRVYEVNKGKGQICDRILRSLPKWFGIEAAVVHYANEVESLRKLRY